MSNYTSNLEELEKMLNVIFNNKNLLKTAVTHSSYAKEIKNTEYNERLEFLGDSVLQISISEYLFKNFPDRPEGWLTRLRSLIVCENSLYEIAKRWSLGRYIIMSKGEELTGGRERTSILADCVEALIAAVYLDKGFETAERFILINFSDIIDLAVNNKIILDYKTKLQEVLQQNGEVDIEYKLIKYDGPAHRRKFFIDVTVGHRKLGYGTGYTKKEAEQNAAHEALNALEAGNE